MDHIAVKAYRAMRYLVHAAQQRERMTYPEFCKQVGVSSREIGAIASYIRDEFCLPRQLPPLHLLIVKSLVAPPSGSFGNGAEHMSKTQRSAAFEKARRRVYRYRHWDALLDELEIAPLLL